MQGCTEHKHKHGKAVLVFLLLLLLWTWTKKKMRWRKGSQKMQIEMKKNTMESMLQDYIWPQFIKKRKERKMPRACLQRTRALLINPRLMEKKLYQGGIHENKYKSNQTPTIIILYLDKDKKKSRYNFSFSIRTEKKKLNDVVFPWVTWPDQPSPLFSSYKELLCVL